jgi:hypothetical protein
MTCGAGEIVSLGNHVEPPFLYGGNTPMRCGKVRGFPRYVFLRWRRPFFVFFLQEILSSGSV